MADISSQCTYCRGSGEIKDRSEEGRDRPCGMCNGTGNANGLPDQMRVITVRLSSELHRRLKREAHLGFMSLNQLCILKLQDEPATDADRGSGTTPRLQEQPASPGTGDPARKEPNAC